MVTRGETLKVSAYISNLLFFGDSFSRYRNKYGSFGRRDRVEFQIEGLTFTLRKTTIGWKLWEKHKPSLKAKHTAILRTKCDEERIDEVKQIVENLCWLTTFAFGSKITCPLIVFSSKNKRLVDRIGRPYPFDNKFAVIPTNFPDHAFKKFVESTYDAFVRRKDDYNLKVLFELYNLSRTAQFIEARFLMSCILMESLKYHYCKNVKHFKQKGDYFYDHSSKKLEFKDILNLLSKDLKITIDISFLTLRNKVIHQGVIGDPSVDLSKEWRKLMDQINHIILKILGYSGRCFSFDKNFQIQMI